MRRACSVTSSRVISHEFRIGRSTVTVSVDGKPGTQFKVSGTPNSYPLVTGSRNTAEC